MKNLARMFKPQTLGFTLVELSIVLVIIGLLIGGILVGQSLIESTKINRVIRELQQYEIATKQFKEKYKYLPGDHPAGNTFNSKCTSANSCRGDGDGKVSMQITTGGVNYLEIRNVWYHLQGSGALNLNLPFNTTGNQISGTYIAGDNFPESSYSDGTAIILGTIGQGIGFTTTASISGKLVLNLAKHTSSSVFLSGGFMKPANAASIDQKTDDGLANSGSFYADQSAYGPYNCLLNDNPASGKYDLTYTDDADGCTIVQVLNP